MLPPKVDQLIQTLTIAEGSCTVAIRNAEIVPRTVLRSMRTLGTLRT